jgi:hypothetical protein
MKKIDLIIVKTFLIIISVFLIASFIIDFKLTLKAIAIVLFVPYISFLFSHIALMYPLVMILITIENRTSNLKLKEKSIILFTLLQLLIFLIACAAIYVVIPIILAMMHNGTIDLTEAFNTIKSL